MQSRNILALMLLAIFLVSLAFSFHYRISPTSDAKAYTRIARNLAAGKGYIANLENAGDIARDDAIVRVGPGYEFFLAGIYWLTGGQNFSVAWGLQALLRVLTALFVYKIAELIFKSYATALLSSALFGFMPDFIVVGGMLLAETLFLFLLAAATYFSLRALEDDKRIYIMISAVLWGYAALVRPTAIPMMFAFALVLFWRKKFARMAFVVAITIILVGAWSLRNSLLYNRPLFTTTAASYALWIGNNPEATGGYDKPERIQELIGAKHSVELSSVALREYFTFIADRPFKFTELQFRKTVQYFSLLRPMGFWIYLEELPVQRLLTLGASAVATAFLFIFGVAGIYLYVKKSFSINYFFASIMALQPLMVIPMYVETRYRYPLYLFLVLFAAYAIRRLFNGERIWKPLVVVAACFVLISGIDTLYSFDVFYSRLVELL